MGDGRERALPEQVPRYGQQATGDGIGEADHRLPADGIEIAAEHQRTQEVAERKRKNIEADVAGRHVVELREHEGVGKRDRIVRERLRGQKHDA